MAFKLLSKLWLEGREMVTSRWSLQFFRGIFMPIVIIDPDNDSTPR